MYIFFIDDKMEATQLVGGLDDRIAGAVMGAEQNRPWKGASGSGSLGVIAPNGMVKATMQFSINQQNHRTKVREFITKYMVLETLIKLGQKIKNQS